MLISFSGYDGAGKTTQIQHLLGYYRKQGLKTASIYDIAPTIRYHSYKDLIEYHHYLKNYDVIHLRFRLNSDENNKLMKTLEYSEFNVLYLAEATALQGFFDYYLLEKYVTRPLLDAGKIVISDRHYYDEVAFKSVYGCDYARMLKMYSEIPKPNLAFYLSVSPQIVFERNQTRPDGQTTIYKSFNLIKKLGHYFECLLEDTNLILINGQDSIYDIHSRICKLIKKPNNFSLL